MKNKILLIITVLLFPLLVAGQNATIRGKVLSGDDGEVLSGATVRIEKDGQVVGGAYADVDGAFVIKTNAGTYNMIASYVTYISDTVEVNLEGGGVFTKEFVLFTEPQMNEVVITAKVNKASDLALDAKKKASVNAVDGVTTDLLARTGDNNVGAAMKRVSGVTVEGGKYIVVRGLGDRYSKATINGAVIPNLDPNRNSVQLDIIPTNLIDNILVYKTFTPDLPGDFTGGLVDVTTKDYPDRLRISLSAGTGFNPQANLRDDFLSYETGSRDWLGFDDGTRALPSYIANLPNGVPGRAFNYETERETIETIDQASRAFNTGMNLSQANSFLNQSYQFSIGNQYNLGKKGLPIGFIAGVSYRNSYKAYNGFDQVVNSSFDQYKLARWSNPGTAGSGTGLTLERESVTQYGGQNVIWGALAKLSFKPGEKHDISVNYMHNQSGNSETMFLDGPFPREDDGLIFQQRNISYIERSMDAVQVEGDHIFGKLDPDKESKIGPLKADWIYSFIKSTQSEPDLRIFSNDYTMQGEERVYDIQANAYPLPTRFFRDLLEFNQDARLNFTLPFKQWSGQNASFKFGGAYTTKDREFGELQYRYGRGSSAPGFNGSVEDYLADGNLGIRLDQIVVRGDTFQQVKYQNFMQDASEDRNQYTAKQSILGAYSMMTLPITQKLETTFGARFEQTEAVTTPGDSTAALGRLNLNDPLPAISFKYRASDKTNIRLSYSRTLARPTFREFSSFASYDFRRNAIVRGNPGLQRTLIDNLDLRYEFYPDFGELISFSVFYKNFTNPIEQVIVPQAQNLEFTWVNIQNALTYGAEFEVRKKLSFLSDKLEKFQLAGNVSVIQSEVDIDPALYEQMIAVDPTRSPTRPLFGQSPYAGNAELAYIDPVKGWKGSLSYSVFGKRLSAVGGTNPDIYEQGRGLLNFSVSRDFFMGEESKQRLSVRFRANNLLNPYFRFVQTYREVDYIFENYQIGRTFSLSVSYSI